MEEALSARSPMKLQQDANENREMRRKDMSAYAFIPLFPLAGFITLFELLGSDPADWQDEWKSSKKPHQE